MILTELLAGVAIAWLVGTQLGRPPSLRQAALRSLVMPLIVVGMLTFTAAVRLAVEAASPHQQDTQITKEVK